MNNDKELQRIKENILDGTLDSLWKKEFYDAMDWGTTPCNSEYWPLEPLRILYDGAWNDNGVILEFTVGVMSNDDYEDFEFFVEDYHGGSIIEHHTTFDSALKQFIEFTGIRNPYIYTDDEDGNAHLTNYKIRPRASVSCD